MNNSSGLDNIINALNAFDFLSDHLCFDGIHPVSLKIERHPSRWSNVDYFDAINVENNILAKHSDMFIVSSRFPLTEKQIYTRLGFNFEKIGSICNLYYQYMTDFNMLEAGFDKSEVFKEKDVVDKESFLGVVHGCNYYSKYVQGGLMLFNNRIFIQLFLDFKNGIIETKAKIVFPLSKESYFSVIIGNDELYSIAEKVVYSGVLSEFKALLIDRYPDECSDVMAFDENMLKQYLTVIDMDGI